MTSTSANAISALLGAVAILSGGCSILFSPDVFEYPDPISVGVWLSGLAICAFSVWAITWVRRQK